mmetsp:Transcript_8270/g.17509  ORF Transcript_8270/g.17509 Transcript_8270/m.17509 type:complete len:238 (-) Transcript_8270:54-767(-)
MTKTGARRRLCLDKGIRNPYLKTTSSELVTEKKSKGCAGDAKIKSIQETPRKDNNRNRLFAFDRLAVSPFSTPRSGTVHDGKKCGSITARPAAVVALVTPSPGTASFTPAAAPLVGSNGSSLGKRRKVDLETAKSSVVPQNSYRILGYLREGDAVLSLGSRRAYDLVKANCHIPKDFDSDPRFGPLSGTCHEERVIAAFSTGMLKVRIEADTDFVEGGVCSWCGRAGHQRGGCLDLI